MDTPKELVSNFNSRDQGKLLHRRMCHIHNGSLKFLCDMVRGVLEVRKNYDDICRGCVLGKFTKAFFLRSDKNLQGILDLVHSNICGPMFTNLSRDTSTLWILSIIYIERPRSTS